MRRSRQSSRALGAIGAGAVALVLTGCVNTADEGGPSGVAGMTTAGSSGAAGVTTAGSSGASGSGSGAGVGGVSGSGGTGGTGGTGGSGGVTATGGSSGSGGTSGSGGVASAGASGSGGASGAGETNGGAGSSATGGVSGSAGVAGASGAITGGGAGDAGAAGAPSTCPVVTPLTGGTEYCSNDKGNAGGGQGYELWKNEGGSGCMTVRSGGRAFAATWSQVDDFLARIGLDFNQTQTHQQIGTLFAEFAETKTEDGGLTYIGVYGWTVSPLVEYYILDDWGSTKPAGIASDGTPRTSVGTIVVDGDTYDVWTKLRENKPAITGDSETFEQYFSIRRNARQCGRISISEHFTKWNDLGLPLGRLHEAKLLIEAQNNSGSAEFTTATVSVD